MSLTCPIVITVAPPAATPANITATSTNLHSQTIEYAAGTTIDLCVVWTNTGGSAGTFTPSVTINSQTIYGNVHGNAAQTLAPGATFTDCYSFNIGSAGTFNVCPNPN